MHSVSGASLMPSGNTIHVMMCANVGQASKVPLRLPSFSFWPHLEPGWSQSPASTNGASLVTQQHELSLCWWHPHTALSYLLSMALINQSALHDEPFHSYSGCAWPVRQGMMQLGSYLCSVLLKDTFTTGAGHWTNNFRITEETLLNLLPSFGDEQIIARNPGLKREPHLQPTSTGGLLHGSIFNNYSNARSHRVKSKRKKNPSTATLTCS